MNNHNKTLGESLGWMEQQMKEELIELDSITMKSLQELDAFSVPNPIVSKAITMRRLLDAGFSEYESKQAIERAFLLNKK